MVSSVSRKGPRKESPRFGRAALRLVQNFLGLSRYLSSTSSSRFAWLRARKPAAFVGKALSTAEAKTMQAQMAQQMALARRAEYKRRASAGSGGSLLASRAL